MIEVTQLCVYPIKSCAALALDEFQIGENGPQISMGSQFIGDRQWMIVTPEGQALTQREQSSLAKISPIIDGNSFGLMIEGEKFEIPLAQPKSARKLVDIWGKQVDAATVAGPVQKRLSEFLEQSVELVQFDQSSKREVTFKDQGLGVQTRFADSQPYLVVSEESMKDLNSRLQTPIPFHRFRPNIVVRGAKAFAEDHWQQLNTKDVGLQTVKPCGRCVIITIDQQTGISPGNEPLKALAQFRRGPRAVLFGQYFLSHSFGSKLKIGDFFHST